MIKSIEAVFDGKVLRPQAYALDATNPKMLRASPYLYYHIWGQVESCT